MFFDSLIEIYNMDLKTGQKVKVQALMFKMKATFLTEFISDILHHKCHFKTNYPYETPRKRFPERLHFR